MLILKTLSLEPMHGFGIGRPVEQISRGGFKGNPGSLLTALRRIDVLPRVWVIPSDLGYGMFAHMMASMSSTRTCATVASLLASLVATLGADQWPQWRGPSASGVSSEAGLPLRWSDTENIAWKASLT